MDNKQIFYYEISYTAQALIDYDEVAQAVIEDNPDIVDDRLITRWRDNIDKYLQLVDFWDAEYLGEDQINCIEDAVAERLEVFIESNADNE